MDPLKPLTPPPVPRLLAPELLWTESGWQRHYGLLFGGHADASGHPSGLIAALGPLDTLTRDYPGVKPERIPRRALVPGHINGHNHGFQVLMRGLGEDDDFFGWRRDILYPVSSRLTRQEIRQSAELAYADMLRHGITTVADFFYLNDHGTDNALALVEAAHAVGIRLVLARTFYDWDGAPARYRETPEDAQAHTLLLSQALAGDPLVSLHVAPHSPHGASARMVQAAVQTAESLDVPLHVHAAEGQYEREQMLRETGLTPIAWLKQQGALSPRTVLIHAVWVDDTDMDLIAEAGSSVIHNPSSNMILGDGIAPVPELLRRGITVGLGTDGGCTNDRHSIFDEMRTAALLQKVHARDGKALSADAAYDMGTEGGAQALRINGGKLAPGRLADFMTLCLDDLSLLPGPPTIRHLVYALAPAAIDQVYVGGRETVRDGQPLYQHFEWAREWQAGLLSSGNAVDS